MYFNDIYRKAEIEKNGYKSRYSKSDSLTSRKCYVLVFTEDDEFEYVTYYGKAGIRTSVLPKGRKEFTQKEAESLQKLFKSMGMKAYFSII